MNGGIGLDGQMNRWCMRYGWRMTEEGMKDRRRIERMNRTLI
jgi:hypothetical protein